MNAERHVTIAVLELAAKILRHEIGVRVPLKCRDAPIQILEGRTIADLIDEVRAQLEHP